MTSKEQNPSNASLAVESASKTSTELVTPKKAKWLDNVFGPSNPWIQASSNTLNEPYLPKKETSAQGTSAYNTPTAKISFETAEQQHAKKVIEAGLELQKYLSGENLAKAVWQPGWETGGWTMMRTSASKTTTETKAPTSKTATETKTPASETTKEKKTPATKTTTTKNLLEAARQRYMDETLARRHGSEREKLRSKRVKEFDAARKSLREFLGAGALDKVVNRGKPKEAPQALGVFLLSLYMVYFLYLLLTAES